MSRLRTRTPSDSTSATTDGYLNGTNASSLKQIRMLAVENRVSLRDVVVAIGDCVERVCARAERELSRDRSVGFTEQNIELDALRPPEITLGAFLWRLVHGLNGSHKEPPLFDSVGNPLSSPHLHNNVSKWDDDRAMGRGLRCLLVALVYVDRISTRPDFRPTTRNIHRLMLGTTLLALKFSDDAAFDGRVTARLGGVSVSELKRVERVICRLLDFDLFISEEYFRQHCMSNLQLAVVTASRQVASSSTRSTPKSASVVSSPRRDSRVDSLGNAYGLSDATPMVTTRKSMAADAAKPVSNAYGNLRRGART